MERACENIEHTAHFRCRLLIKTLAIVQYNRFGWVWSFYLRFRLNETEVFWVIRYPRFELYPVQSAVSVI